LAEVLSGVVLETAWNKVLDRVQRAVTPKRFQLWFKNTRLVEQREDKLIVGVPNLFVKEWLEEKFSQEILSAVREVCGEEKTFEIRIDGRLFQEARKQSIRETGRAIEEAGKVPAVAPGELTLETFVVGPCNRMAYGASTAVAQNPGSVYNPLFIHGSVGVGKTHLLRGISHQARGKYPHLQAAYMSGESFTNQFIMALKTRSLDAFRDKVRRLDLLIIDDIHFLANKNDTQEEFLNTFNCLSGLAKQIVMASDAHPKQLKSIKASLTTRFMSGLVVELAAPELATRVKILENKLGAARVHLQADLLRFVAKRITGSVRDLEGACNLLRAFQNLTHRRLDRAAVEEALHAMADAVHYVGLGDVLREVAARMDVEEKEILGDRRNRPVADARHLVMYLGREMGFASYAAIGEFLGGRSHSTVMLACRKIRKALSKDETLAALERTIRATLARKPR